MNSSKGFTLIELLVVIGIVGILAAIAVPNYQNSIRKSRRAEAQAALLGFSGAMERHYTIKSTYKGAAEEEGNTGAPANTTFTPSASISMYYSFNIDAADTDTYTLSAAPLTDTPQETDPCGTLTLDNAGNKDALDTNGDSVSDCWK